VWESLLAALKQLKIIANSHIKSSHINTKLLVIVQLQEDISGKTWKSSQKAQSGKA
jgi:hypothetical protein